MPWLADIERGLGSSTVGLQHPEAHWLCVPTLNLRGTKILKCKGTGDYGTIIFFPSFFLKKAFIFFNDFIYLFLERGGREGEKGGENYQRVVASCALHTGDLARNPGMCPDWELNW